MIAANYDHINHKFSIQQTHSASSKARSEPRLIHTGTKSEHLLFCHINRIAINVEGEKSVKQIQFTWFYARRIPLNADNGMK